MSEPEPLSVKTPFENVAVPATLTDPTSRLDHPAGRPGLAGGFAGTVGNALFAHGVKSTSFPPARMASPVPGPSPRGPDALPHQLFRASKNPTCRSETTTSPSRAV